MLVEVLSAVQPYLPPRASGSIPSLLDPESPDSDREAVIEVNAVALIGGHVVSARTRAGDDGSRSIRPQEKLSLCVPVEFGSDGTGPVHLLQSRSEASDVRDAVLRQFIYLRYEALQFQMLLVRAKLVMAEEEREDPRGPRTISEIRRENQKARAMMQAMDSQVSAYRSRKFGLQPCLCAHEF